jgi:hypothetical protein
MTPAVTTLIHDSHIAAKLVTFVIDRLRTADSLAEMASIEADAVRHKGLRAYQMELVCEGLRA